MSPQSSSLPILLFSSSATHWILILSRSSTRIYRLPIIDFSSSSSGRQILSFSSSLPLLFSSLFLFLLPTACSCAAHSSVFSLSRGQQFIMAGSCLSPHCGRIVLYAQKEEMCLYERVLHILRTGITD